MVLDEVVQEENSWCYSHKTPDIEHDEGYITFRQWILVPGKGLVGFVVIQ